LEQLDHSGCLIHSLLNRLEKFFEAKLDENILLTEIFSMLVRESIGSDDSICFRALFAKLFGDPFQKQDQQKENKGDGGRTMASILEALWTKARQKYEGTPQAASRTELIRYTLGIESWGTEKQISDKRPAASEAASPFLENYVLLEEFLKEVYSILRAQADFYPELHTTRAGVSGAGEDVGLPEGEDMEVDDEDHGGSAAGTPAPEFDVERFEEEMRQTIAKLEEEFMSDNIDSQPAEEEDMDGSAPPPKKNDSHSGVEHQGDDASFQL